MKGTVPMTLAEAEMFMELVKRAASRGAPFDWARWNGDGTAVLLRCRTARGEALITQCLRDEGLVPSHIGTLLIEVTF